MKKAGVNLGVSPAPVTSAVEILRVVSGSFKHGRHEALVPGADARRWGKVLTTISVSRVLYG